MSATVTAVDHADPESIVSALVDEPLRRENPYELYASLREAAPIHRSDAHGMWVLTRYADVMAALRHPGMSMAGVLEASPRFERSAVLQLNARTMLFCDDPGEHSRLRKLVRQAFTRQTVQGLRPYVAGLIDRLATDCLERGTFDYMNDFVEHVPVSVICHMLGVPEEDIPVFAEWNFLLTTATGVGLSEEHMLKVDEAAVNLTGYLNELLEFRKRTPGDDVLTRLIEARDGTEQLTEEETVAMSFLLLAAGSDTTSAFLGAGTLALLRHPEQFAKLRADRALLPNAIEELLRFEAPVHFGIMRTVTTPFTVDGVEIPVGDQVWTILSAGNRDPARFQDPDRLDIEREDIRHLAFAQGMHMCLGAMLGRLESTVVLEAVLDRFATLELREERVPWVNHGNLRGISRLMVEGTGR